MHTPSERRLVENELVFRQLNEQVQEDVDKVNRMAVETGQSDLKIMQGRDGARLHFYCECSDIDCNERIIMSYDEYEQLHRRRDHFIVRPGHEARQVERLVSKRPSYYVVEKFALPAVTVEARPPSGSSSS